jgi:hypothetical protein
VSRGGYGGDKQIQAKKRRNDTMKYLVIASSNGIPIPPEQAINIYKAAIAWTNERIKNGMIEADYIFIGGGGFSIANVNSQEQGYDELLSFPLYPFFDWEVKPLVDWKHAYNSAIELYKKMGAK